MGNPRLSPLRCCPSTPGDAMRPGREGRERLSEEPRGKKGRGAKGESTAICTALRAPRAQRSPKRNWPGYRGSWGFPGGLAPVFLPSIWQERIPLLESRKVGLKWPSQGQKVLDRTKGGEGKLCCPCSCRRRAPASPPRASLSEAAWAAGKKEDFPACVWTGLRTAAHPPPSPPPLSRISWVRRKFTPLGDRARLHIFSRVVCGSKTGPPGLMPGGGEERGLMPWSNHGPRQ
ncbi:uncharacterized protein LOC114023815 [Vombatus ursinus]|uniref:uncharacterized protein LOC114023815 n=1 Tax=Vombatus ursinus TaxID=29139 RepID=UPI000FFD5C37|nr:uncharacterized protein LOC114023815 [Vombatus ursinus]